MKDRCPTEGSESNHILKELSYLQIEGNLKIVVY